MTQALFRDNAYLKTCTSKIIWLTAEGIVLDSTIFYPLGGGQPGDTGVLKTESGRIIHITDTHKGEQGTIVHITDPSQVSLLRLGETVNAEIDWQRRYAHMRMHTGLHLLSAVLPYGVTGGAIHAEKSRLDFDMPDTLDKDTITERLNALITADHLVQTRWITDEELDAHPELVKTMSVQPPRGVGRIRLLEIPGVDLQPCGGTHVARTGEIGPLRIQKVEKKGQHNRRVIVEFANIK